MEEFKNLPEYEIKPGDEVVVKELKAGNKAVSKRNNLYCAKILLSKHVIIHSEEQFYQYIDGVYVKKTPRDIKKLILDAHGDLTPTNLGDILDKMRTYSNVNVDRLNNTKFLNLRNGLFNIDTFNIIPHTPENYSTIRIDVEPNSQSECPKWIEAVTEIVEDEENISALQEFFGLCLTTETHDKALILTGEGSNGKSTLLDVLGGILGAENISQVPLVRLEDTNFVAQLHGKLLNIASEIGSKNTVCDETFKKIISHDEIMGAHKYSHPFSFRPTCKLIFATNNMPRTDDKTKALYRRLLVIRLEKEFTEDISKHKYHRVLLEERSGIFKWMVEGLRRLRERGRFAMGKRMISAIEEYKRENNPVMFFIEEECVIGADETVQKRNFFAAYKDFCKESGYHPIGIGRFGKEVKRVLGEKVLEDRNSAGNARIWRGVRLLVDGETRENERPF